jgi:ribose transport system substrate-binding protein
MKKLTVLVILLGLLSSMITGCGTSSGATSQPETAAQSPTEAAQEIVDNLREEAGDKALKYVGMCFPSLGHSWFVTVKDEITSILEAEGVKVEVASSDDDHSRQMEIVENYGEKGIDGLILFPIGASEIGGTLEKLQAKGIRVIVFINQVDKGYDGMLLTNYAEQGVQCAKMAAEWIDKTFPDAAPGSVEVGVLSISMSPESKAVSDGMLGIEQYTSKAKVVVNYEATFDDAEAKSQENTEMILVNFPDVKAILCYNHALSVDEVIMRTPGIDRAKFGIFTNTFDAAVSERIGMSRTDASVIRGNSISGTGHYYDVGKAMLGQIEFNAEKIFYDPIMTITADNVDEFQQ